LNVTLSCESSDSLTLTKDVIGANEPTQPRFRRALQHTPTGMEIYIWIFRIDSRYQDIRTHHNRIRYIHYKGSRFSICAAYINLSSTYGLFLHNVIEHIAGSTSYHAPSTSERISILCDIEFELEYNKLLGKCQTSLNNDPKRMRLFVR